MDFDDYQFQQLEKQCVALTRRAAASALALRQALPLLHLYEKIKFQSLQQQCLNRKKLSSLDDLRSLLEQKQNQQQFNTTQLRKKQTQFKVLQIQTNSLQSQLAQVSQQILNCKNRIQTFQEESSKIRHIRKAQQEAQDQAKRQIAQKTLYLDSLRKRAEEIAQVKRRLNNQLQELKGNIRVYCRIRPFLKSDPSDQINCQLFEISESQLLLRVPETDLKSQSHQREYKFSFQHIFPSECSQQDVFNELAELVQSALDGKSVCVFAYGPTGSGKTFTMQGQQQQQQGIIPRTAHFIFNQIKKAGAFGGSMHLFLSVQEVYLQSIRDLLDPDNKRQEPVQFQANSPQEVAKLIARAKSNRKVAETNCNQHSSRSHCICTLKIRGLKDRRQGSLNLIDLAGSQRVGQSKVQGERMKQTLAINKSLTSLSQVISALSRKDSHIPYRNSKLTYLLQPYLQGDSKTLMLVNISPLRGSYHTSLCALRFAQDVKRVRGNLSPIKCK